MKKNLGTLRKHSVINFVLKLSQILLKIKIMMSQLGEISDDDEEGSNEQSEN